jgi:hypothetical protein
MERAKKQFIFNWEGGGFNFVMAKTLPGAKKKVKEEWSHHPRLVPVMSSVRFCTEEELRRHMALWD